MPVAMCSRRLLDEVVDGPTGNEHIRAIYGINDTGWISGMIYDYDPNFHFFVLLPTGPLHNPGDVNSDNFVGGADLTAIIDNWGMSPADWEDGDIDPFDAGDNFIGGAD